MKIKTNKDVAVVQDLLLLTQLSSSIKSACSKQVIDTNPKVAKIVEYLHQGKSPFEGDNPYLLTSHENFDLVDNVKYFMEDTDYQRPVRLSQNNYSTSQLNNYIGRYFTNSVAANEIEEIRQTISQLPSPVEVEAYLKQASKPESDFSDRTLTYVNNILTAKKPALLHNALKMSKNATKYLENPNAKNAAISDKLLTDFKSANTNVVQLSKAEQTKVKNFKAAKTVLVKMATILAAGTIAFNGIQAMKTSHEKHVDYKNTTFESVVENYGTDRLNISPETLSSLFSIEDKLDKFYNNQIPTYEDYSTLLDDIDEVLDGAMEEKIEKAYNEYLQKNNTTSERNNKPLRVKDGGVELGYEQTSNEHFHSISIDFTDNSSTTISKYNVDAGFLAEHFLNDDLDDLLDLEEKIDNMRVDMVAKKDVSQYDQATFFRKEIKKLQDIVDRAKDVFAKDIEVSKHGKKISTTGVELPEKKDNSTTNRNHNVDDGPEL